MAQMDLINLFNGIFKGINTKVSPEKLDPNETPHCVNIIGNAEYGTIETIPGYSTPAFSPNPILGAPGGATSTAVTLLKQVTFSNGASYLVIQSGNKILKGKLRPSSLKITTNALDAGTHGVAYTFTVVATGGTTTYTWSVVGTLPTGITIAAATGIISGTTTQTGTFDFDVQVVDTVYEGVVQTTRKGFRLVIA